MTWAQMDSWCAAAGLRLPTEEEWEYACRAGSTGAWSFGNGSSRLGEYAWFFRNSGKELLSPFEDWDKARVEGEWGCRPHAVMGLAPNAFGFHDMHGNLWERCAPAGPGPLDDGPMGRATTAMRGGSWYSVSKWTRSASRHVSMHDNVAREVGRAQASSTDSVTWGGWRSPHIGFRPAADLP